MSTEPSSPAKKDATTVIKSPDSKGKSKAKVPAEDISMEEEEEEEEEEDEEEGEEEMEEEEEEDELEEIDPSAIVSRRTRGVRVDYTSEEALEKAGLTKDDHEDDDDDMEH
ncbi:uncharacterized protein BJ212DRAFT_1481229 [Suillus subaureus]|uniref:Histone chaperone domain-containing protein n=1 Tax=Suillus subaureus TaxID=48587 RepID=A0A9P7APQ8_9AGAM|nr:uncharacterized protein BJ212DRAFT_1307047 [Suillus subaureus]XP_041192959.1 uncharacterized protein BJ212DRAFT_1481229 [Suillus subaureus]KAG1793761.1 hypothetical protein BJ212DRAFT_1307047 [Suillus subaureus]KAG1816153.1 hypothetical protein BJ212DRAFT_1481229 [Suillus subaureus]